MSRAATSLSQRRQAIENQRSEFTAKGTTVPHQSVSQHILSSWQRSAKYVAPTPSYAPADDEYITSRLWEESPLSLAAQHEQQNMEQLVKEGSLVVAIADPCGRLLWTYASNHMRRRAESLNFTAGGHWDEESVGTNAVGLSLSLKRAVTVFSSEHYLPIVRDWVCYAAPIIHPQSGECVGILDMSTTWNRHTPLGQCAVTEIARSIASNLPENLPRAELEIYALGQAYVRFQGMAINLTPRQIEILCLLALNAEGLSLNNLHAALYGDSPVSTATLKAEISHLRHILKGSIGSRPYRLLLPVWADFIHLWKILHEQKINEAISLYRGAFLPQSKSPELEEWRYCISAVVDQVLGACKNPDVLIERLHQNTSKNEEFRERLLELMSNTSKRL